jgi:hypothetical protein
LSADVKYPKTFFEPIAAQDRDNISITLINKYQWEPSDTGGLITPSLEESDVAVLCKQIGLAISGDFFLLEHEIKGNNDRTVSFFTLYMHLKPLGQFGMSSHAKGAWKNLRNAALPFGVHKPFYIDYRFKCDTSFSVCTCVEATPVNGGQDKKLPVRLVIGTRFNMLKERYAGEGDASVPSNQIVCSMPNGYHSPGGEKENPERVLVDASVVEPGPRNNNNNLDRMSCSINKKSPLCIERNGVLSEVGIMLHAETVRADMRPDSIRRQSGSVFAKVFNLNDICGTKSELKNTQGYIALNRLKLVSIPKSTSQHYKVKSASPLFQPVTGTANLPDAYISGEDWNSAKTDAFHFNRKYWQYIRYRNSSDIITTGRSGDCHFHPVMYVRENDMVVAVDNAHGTDLLETDAKGNYLGGGTDNVYIKVRYTVEGIDDFFVNLNDLSSDEFVYYQIKAKPANGDDSLYFPHKDSGRSGLYGLPIYDTKEGDAVIDFIDSPDTEFTILNLDKVYGNAEPPEIICYKEPGSQAPRSYGFLKALYMPHCSLKWEYKHIANDVPKDEIQYPGIDIPLSYGAILGEAGQAETETAVHLECFTKNKGTPLIQKALAGKNTPSLPGRPHGIRLKSPTRWRLRFLREPGLR